MGDAKTYRAASDSGNAEEEPKVRKRKFLRKERREEGVSSCTAIPGDVVPRQSKRRDRNTREVVKSDGTGTVESQGGAQPPRSFVVRRGHVHRTVRELIRNWRHVLMPDTALKLQERRQNSLKDYTSVASAFGVTHLVFFTETPNNSIHWRLARLPSGPTLTFRVESFSLCSDVRAHQKRQRVSAKEFAVSPIVVLKGFRESTTTVTAGGPPLKLLSTFFGSMFPPIDIERFSERDCRRVVLFQYNRESQTLDVRHYAVVKRPAGILRATKRIFHLRSNPRKELDLGSYKTNQSVFLDSGVADASDTDTEAAELVSPHGLTKLLGSSNATSATKLAVSLSEIGPRMRVRLIKVESDVATGQVLYHSFVSKTPKELQRQAEIEPEQQKKRKKAAEDYESMLEQIAKRKRKRHKQAAGSGSPHAPETEGHIDSD